MKIVFSLLTVLLLLASLTFGTLIRARQIEKAFASLRPGDSKAQVEHVMGSSRKTTACTTIPKAEVGCATEMLYAHPLAPVVPEYWTVRMDATGHVQQAIQSTVRSSY